MSHRRDKKPWEKRTGSYAVSKTPIEEDTDPDPEPVKQGPKVRPGDKLRRIAAYSAAASRPTSKSTTCENWSLKELIDLLTEEYD